MNPYKVGDTVWQIREDLRGVEATAVVDSDGYFLLLGDWEPDNFVEISSVYPGERDARKALVEQLSDRLKAARKQLREMEKREEATP